MADSRSIVFLKDLSSCDFACIDDKLRVKTASFVNDETGGNAPSSPTTPTSVPTVIADHATIVEVFDDLIRYWTFECALGWTLIVEVGRSSSAIYDVIGGCISKVTVDAKTDPDNPPANPFSGNVVVEIYDNYHITFHYDGAAWSQLFSDEKENRNIKTVVANYTIDPDCDSKILADSSSTTVTIQLPTPTAQEGEVYRIKGIDLTNGVILDPNGTTIDGGTSFAFKTVMDSYDVTFTSGAWWIF
jgi:hypothetical protein